MNRNKQTILVTGASSGMGKAFAKALLQAGHTVYAAARRLDAMNDLQALGAITLAMDVTNEQQIQQAFEQISKKHNGLDVLINNAGFGLYGAMEDVTIDEARYQFEVNLFGLARVTQMALPYMRTKRQGKIINISSMGGKVYTPLGSWYHATKHALEGWSDCLRLELSPFNISVVVIEPGLIETEFGEVVSGLLVARSGNGAYKDMTNKVAESTTQMTVPGNGSKPDVITKLVLQVVNTDKPKTRYAAGKYAKPMMWIRKWLGDRVFDRAIMASLK